MPFNDLWTQLKRQSVERALNEPRGPSTDFLNPGRTLTLKEQVEQARRQLPTWTAQEKPPTTKRSPLEGIGQIKGALDRMKGR